MDGNFKMNGQAVLRENIFHAFDPATDTVLPPVFAEATAQDVADACALAETAFDAYRDLPPETRARFLDAIARQLDALGDAPIEWAMTETGLPRARLTGELGRTTGQLRLFARVLREGRWAGVVIDSALPNRQPLPRPDLRKRRVAVGPVAVFGASNFPLAFSVAGGDTAAALAAGAPVVCKGHPAHPGTSALVACAIQAAAAECELPAGVFSLLQGSSHALGAALVADPRIMAVGFTGSRAGGLALIDVARRRPVPIPVYAEMSSVNPVILLPAALAARADALGAAFVASLTMGAGQFCTNPGLLLGVAGPDLDRFCDAAANAIAASPPQVMLTSRIHAAFTDAVARLARHGGVALLGQGPLPSGPNRGRAALFGVTAASFISDPGLAHEMFGPAAIVVRCADMDELRVVLAGLEGQLTITLHLAPEDHGAARALLPLLERRAGRILANGWPTGVEVCAAMVHGGPYPATSDIRATSVGSDAIERFLRPVCYQDLPDDLLPLALQETNPLGLPRLVG